jgi:hypothetical protein
MEHLKNHVLLNLLVYNILFHCQNYNYQMIYYYKYKFETLNSYVKKTNLPINDEW